MRINYTIKNLVFIFFLLETFMRGRQRVYTWVIIKAKIDMYHVNITESEGSLVNFLNQCEAWFATGNIWDLWISFIILWKLSYFFEIMHTRREVWSFLFDVHDAWICLIFLHEIWSRTPLCDPVVAL